MLHRTRHTGAALLLGSVLTLVCAAAWSDSLPRVTLKTLEGSSFVVPGDLGGGTSILVVGFTRKAGANTRPWVERLRTSFHGDDGFAVYPVAVLAGVPALFRSFALNAIRAGVDPQERGSFLVVEQDETAWRTLAGPGMEDDPFIIVVDKTGSVLAREEGLFDEAKWQDLQARIRSFGGRKS